MKRRRPGRHVRRVRSKRGRRNIIINKDVAPAVKRRVVREYSQNVGLELKRTGRVRIPEVGILSVKTKKARPARMGRHPATGQIVKFKAKPKSKVIKFRPAIALKRSIIK